MANKTIVTVTSVDQLESLFPELETSNRYSDGKKFRPGIKKAFESGFAFDAILVDDPKNADPSEFFRTPSGKLYAALIVHKGEKSGTAIKNVNLNKHVVNRTGNGVAMTDWSQMAQIIGKMMGGTYASNQLTNFVTCDKCGGTGKVYTRTRGEDTCWKCSGVGKFLEPKKGK